MCVLYSFRHLGHVQDDLTQVGVGLHVLVRGLRLLEPVLRFGLGVGFGLGSGFGLRPERVRVRVRVQTLPLTRTLNPSRDPNLLEPVELAVDDDGKVAAEARHGARDEVVHERALERHRARAERRGEQVHALPEQLRHESGRERRGQRRPTEHRVEHLPLPMDGVVMACSTGALVVL